MRIKPLIIEMMDRDFPEFRFVGSPSFFYVFRRKSQYDLFDYIKYQRDGKTGALAVDVATTYDPNWNLYPTGPIGLDYPLVVYKNRRRIVTGAKSYLAEEPWYIYENDKSEFQTVLVDISKDLTNFGLKFFREAARTLESDQLLQHGLKQIRESGALSENELAALQKNIEAANYRSVDISNEHLNYLKQNLLSYANQINASREKRHSISALAIRLLFLQPDKLL